MTDTSKFARGGMIEGPRTLVKMERLGQCIHGMCLYSIGGGWPEHILSAAEARVGDTRKLTCPCGGRATD